MYVLWQCILSVLIFQLRSRTKLLITEIGTSEADLSLSQVGNVKFIMIYLHLSNLSEKRAQFSQECLFRQHEFHETFHSVKF